ncbi:Spo0E family sporulation regulatory protein-aspartic acid phosphatase [Haloimpatiens sp. FM7315]
MNKLVKEDKASLCKGEILKISQQLDKLILNYYLSKNS